MPDKVGMGEKAQCTGVYMSILSPFPTPHGAARGFFNSLLGLDAAHANLATAYECFLPQAVKTCACTTIATGTPRRSDRDEENQE
jgi:hypothetical protein